VFQEFNNDKSFLSSSFYFLFFLRRFLYVGILYSLEAYPLVQVILNILHSLYLSSSTRFILMWATHSVVYSMMLVNFIVTVILLLEKSRDLCRSGVGSSAVKANSCMEMH
jgi:hypothetical protein